MVMASQCVDTHAFSIGCCYTEQGTLYVGLVPNERFQSRAEAEKRIGELSAQDPEAVFAIVTSGQI